MEGGGGGGVGGAVRGPRPGVGPTRLHHHRHICTTKFARRGSRKDPRTSQLNDLSAWSAPWGGKCRCKREVEEVLCGVEEVVEEEAEVGLTGAAAAATSPGGSCGRTGRPAAGAPHRPHHLPGQGCTLHSGVQAAGCRVWAAGCKVQGPGAAR